ncbi:MAG: peptidase M15 [Spirobacillus cienkowskii]|uniref:Peptidase M15 n=1 Tax=Spirobacillus cienkowskii TaxID=495820 RepID=A0A369KUU9_9BACT|nr:MAG: peptidase M15 [Spirobacillus cienkowskii]
MKLSDNFILREFEFSNKAKDLEICNKAPENVIINLKLICANFLEVLRKEINCPIKISSGYRCHDLNKAVGGTENSKHIYGQAVDIYVDKYSAIDLYNYIKENKKNFDYDQLIYEKSGLKKWVHVSYINKEANRKQDLILGN